MNVCRVCRKPITREARHCRGCRPKGGLVGEDNPFAKLSSDQVLGIRAAAGMTQEQVARMFGCSRSNVSLIRRHVAWRHI